MNGIPRRVSWLGCQNTNKDVKISIAYIQVHVLVTVQKICLEQIFTNIGNDGILQMAVWLF